MQSKSTTLLLIMMVSGLSFILSYHCVPTTEYFTSYGVENFGSIKMGSNGIANIVGIGDICIQTNVGCIVLTNVRHILGLCLNIISMSALDKEGYKHQFGEGIWKLT